MKTSMQIAIESYKNDGVSFTDWFIDNYLILLAKEKDQIQNSYLAGFKDGYYKTTINDEEYYNETYKQTENDENLRFY